MKFPHMTRLAVSRKITIGVILLVLFGGSVFVVLCSNDATKSGRKVVYKADDPPIKFGEPTFKIPADAKNSVCDKLSGETVASITKEKNDGARVTILDTKTTDGSVAACNYTTTNSRQAKNIRSVSVTVRTLSSDKAATDAFNTLAQSLPGAGSGEAVFSASANQLIARKGDKLITIGLIKSPGSKADAEAMARGIANKL